MDPKKTNVHNVTDEVIDEEVGEGQDVRSEGQDNFDDDGNGNGDGELTNSHTSEGNEDNIEDGDGDGEGKDDGEEGEEDGDGMQWFEGETDLVEDWKREDELEGELTVGELEYDSTWCLCI